MPGVAMVVQSVVPLGDLSHKACLVARVVGPGQVDLIIDTAVATRLPGAVGGVGGWLIVPVRLKLKLRSLLVATLW